MTILDCNNFWSPSGGGVRRYHLQKLEFFKKHKEDQYYFLMSSDTNKFEKITKNVHIRHIKAFKIPGNWEYRLLFNVFRLRKAIKQIQPDAIEIGSPYILPWMIPLAMIGLKKARIYAFWHADFPITYINRGLSKIHPIFGKIGEKIAWFYTRRTYGKFENIFVGSKKVMEHMTSNGVHNVKWVPLGVDSAMFHPDKKNEKIAKRLKDKQSDRLTIFFPHRFCQEKGLQTLLNAYPILIEKLGYEPALILGGTGPALDSVLKAEKKYKHVKYLGFLKNRKDMAKYYASCDLGLALSSWETFGLTILEAMASGQIIIGANMRASYEHVTKSKSGAIVKNQSAEALAEAIAKVWLKGDHEKMKNNARKYAEKFSWENCFSIELKEYHKVSRTSRTKRSL